MTTVKAMEKPSGQRLSPRVGARLLGRYRALKRRIVDMLMRGDRDYSMLSALSQEIGRMRQSIRADLQRRRDQRRQRKAAPRTL